MHFGFSARLHLALISHLIGHSGRNHRYSGEEVGHLQSHTEHNGPDKYAIVCEECLKQCVADNGHKHEVCVHQILGPKQVIFCAQNLYISQTLLNYLRHSSNELSLNSRDSQTHDTTNCFRDNFLQIIVNKLTLDLDAQIVVFIENVV